MDIQHKETDQRGFFFIKGERGVISELTYTKEEGVLTIDHTETKIPQEGKGLASKLVAAVVDYAREHRYTIEPLCPFAEVQFDKHQEYKDVRA
ncbi:MAG: GNAT family N-acetyltransferase [Dokdonia sp.]|jgi:predicted GNAT family acetyltransferase|nr:GNAT family N-acetyltransferase [Cytophagaceae bacterium]|tara:strand:- start:93 stop:371 length:279 start_codon:yes stop_codon:yes gene_type:complete